MASLPQPPETLETARLWLRAPRLSDAPLLHAAVLESLPELRPYMRWVTPDYTIAACKANTHAAMTQFAAGDGLRYHFFDNRSEQFVGNASFHHIDALVPKLELGYWLRTSRSRGGLMREAVTALCEMAEQELGAARLEIRCDTRNTRSARVAEACGFRLEGVLRNACRDPQGQLRDTRLYARVRR